ncbi:hypothetical protein GCM10022404_28260 [Celeribacter arenosi]|uniref:Uncharacterized protein n=1 Tax=Celeribacter arenosi TaxID=792649 RepID=A0ABP7KGP8_9RHOB
MVVRLAHVSDLALGSFDRRTDIHADGLQCTAQSPEFSVQSSPAAAFGEMWPKALGELGARKLSTRFQKEKNEELFAPLGSNIRFTPMNAGDAHRAEY